MEGHSQPKHLNLRGPPKLFSIFHDRLACKARIFPSFNLGMYKLETRKLMWVEKMPNAPRTMIVSCHCPTRTDVGIPTASRRVA